MAEPMSLRRAVLLSRVGMPADASLEVMRLHDRARAIVDAAVEAHERFCAWQDTPTTRAAAVARMCAASAFDAAVERLRALERGEEGK